MRLQLASNQQWLQPKAVRAPLLESDLIICSQHCIGRDGTLEFSTRKQELLPTLIPSRGTGERGDFYIYVPLQTKGTVKMRWGPVGWGLYWRLAGIMGLGNSDSQNET
jgi:hypothetical protein